MKKNVTNKARKKYERIEKQSKRRKNNLVKSFVSEKFQVLII